MKMAQTEFVQSSIFEGLFNYYLYIILIILYYIIIISQLYCVIYFNYYYYTINYRYRNKWQFTVI